MSTLCILKVLLCFVRFCIQLICGLRWRYGWLRRLEASSIWQNIRPTSSITERVFDPDTRVAISTDVTESSEKSQDSRGGDVTVASNLPGGDAAGGDGSSNNENSQSRALTNYEVNETHRQLTGLPGDIRRITVAVLVNDVTTTDDAGAQVVTPRSPEELADLESLVASAIGFDAERGDEITLKSMPFEPLAELGSVAATSVTTPLNLMQLIQIGVLAIVALILGLFVVRPILAPAQIALPKSSDLPPPMLPGSTGDRAIPMNPAQDMESGSSFPAIENDPVEKLRQMITEREGETIQILQSWMEQSDEVEKAQ